MGTAALASTGYIGIVSLTHLVMFNPLAGDAAASIALPALSSDPTKVEFEIGSAETPFWLPARFSVCASMAARICPSCDAVGSCARREREREGER